MFIFSLIYSVTNLYLQLPKLIFSYLIIALMKYQYLKKKQY